MLEPPSRDLGAAAHSARSPETDLIYRDGKWFLYATVKALTGRTAINPVNGFVGVDLGIVNIATTSDGIARRGALEPATAGASGVCGSGCRPRRPLGPAAVEKAPPQRARFAADVNHLCSKRIVAEAERTGRGIAVEQLTGIRARVRLRKPQRAALHTWAFARLGEFLRYKAGRRGWRSFRSTPPTRADLPRPGCRWIDKHNRSSQAVSSVVGVASLGTPTTTQRSTSPTVVSSLGEVMRPHAAPTLTAS